MNHPSPNPQAALRVLTELDHARLTGLLRRDAVPEDCVDQLEDLLSNADLVPVKSVPATVATMRSQLLVIDSAGSEHKLTLCYPADADAATGKISVLSAIGLGLLGRSVGQEAHWDGPDGQAMTAKLQAIAYQPEAAGDFQV
jgi:regulator of nucleoside diphosphate kinase